MKCKLCLEKKTKHIKPICDYAHLNVAKTLRSIIFVVSAI